MDIEFLNVFIFWLGIVIGIFLIWGTFGFILKKVIKKRILSANVTSDFDVTYEELVRLYTEKLDRKKKIGIIIITIFLIFIIFSIPLIGYVDEYTKIDLDIYSKVSAILIIAGIIGICTNEYRFKELYKKEIVGTIAKIVNPSFGYRKKERNALKEQYRDAGFRDEQYDFIVAYDYMLGTLNGSANIDFGYLDVKKINRHQYIFSHKNTYTSVFYGVVACMKYNNNIKGKIEIENNNVVDANNELPEYLINRLSDVYEKCSIISLIIPEIIIKPNCVYLRIGTTGGDYFEPGENPIDKQKLFDYYNIIKCINEVMAEIKNATEV